MVILAQLNKIMNETVINKCNSVEISTRSEKALQRDDSELRRLSLKDPGRIRRQH